MNSSWNNYGRQTDVVETPAPAQAWQHQPAYSPQPQAQPDYSRPAAQPPFPQFPPAQQFGNAGMPPQGPGFGGYQGFGPQAPKPNKIPLIISLVVAVVVLIGGGVGAFFLLNKDDSTASDTRVPAVTGTSAPTLSNPVDPTTSTTPATSAETPTRTSTTGEPTSSEPTTNAQTDTGGGDMDTAENLVANWLGIINNGDIETAANLICQAEQQDFIDGFDGIGVGGAHQLEAIDMQWDGDNIALTIGAVGDTTGDSYVSLTMWPTNTGYFLICSNPLSDEDLNW